MHPARTLLPEPADDRLTKPGSRVPQRPPWRVGLGAVLLTVLLHGLVITGWPRAVGHGTASPVTSVQWRAAAEPAPRVAPTDTAAPVAQAQVAPQRAAPSGASPDGPLQAGPAVATDAAPAAAADVRPEPASESADALPAVLAESPPEAASAPASAAAMAVALPEPAAAAATVEALSTAEAPLPGPAASSPLRIAEAGEPLPVYPTRFAPSQTLAFQLRRGLLTGSAVLEWERGTLSDPGAQYRLQLTARAVGLSVLAQTSQGGFDPAGLAPRRFTDQRLRGPERAANFQRERGRIIFSGPSVEYAWADGVQDRLSWMLQLPAIVEANPGLARPGERITLAVIGARGDAAVWVFRFEAAERVAVAGGGEVATLKFIREPRRPNDTQAEVWLDPARQHLPARARLSQPPDGDVMDLVRDGP